MNARTHTSRTWHSAPALPKVTPERPVLQACTADIHASEVATLGTGSGIESVHPHQLVVPLSDITADVMVDMTHGITARTRTR